MMMGKILRFKDTRFACWSRVNLDNGDPIYISIARQGILVKGSKLGFAGAILFKERNIYKAAAAAQKLDSEIDEYATPPNMSNAALKAFTQAAIDSKSAAELCIKLNTALEAE